MASQSSHKLPAATGVGNDPEMGAAAGKGGSGGSTVLEPPGDAGEVWETEEEVCSTSSLAGIAGCSTRKRKGAKTLVSLHSSSRPLKDVIKTDFHKMYQHTGEEDLS